MASYDAHVGDFGTTLTWTVSVAGASVGDLTGAVFSVRAVNPSATEDTWTSGFTGLTGSQVQFVVPADTYWDEEGTWTLHVRYTLGSVTRTLDPIQVRVGPRGSTATGSVAGATTASGLTAQITALSAVATADNPIDIVLPEGTWALDAAVTRRSYVRLRGVRPGAVRLRITRASKTDVVGDTDDVTNTAFPNNSALAAGSTTVSTRAYVGASSIVLTNAGALTGLAAGDWLLVSGNNAALGWTVPGESDAVGITFYEVVQVASSYVSGNTIPLASPLRRPWDALITVQRFLTMCVGSGLIDLTIEAPSGQYVATAIHARHEVEPIVEGVRFKGFTRAAIRGDRGTCDGRFVDLQSTGANNGLVQFDSCHGNLVDGVWVNPRGERYHSATSAVPRGMLEEQHACADNVFANVEIDKAVFGLRVFGSKRGTYRNIKVRNCNNAQGRTRLVAVSEATGGARMGVGVWIGDGLIGNAEFAQDLSFENVDVIDCVTPDAADRPFWFHDIRYSRIRGVSIINKGQVADMDWGIEFHDCLSCVVEGLVTNGVDNAINFSNDPQDLQIFGISQTSAAGDSNATVAMRFDTSSARGIVIHGWHVVYSTGAGSGIVAWGAAFAADSMLGYEFRDTWVGGTAAFAVGHIGRMYMADHQDSTQKFLGQAVDLTATTSGRRVAQPSAKSTRCAAVGLHDALTNGYCLVQDLGHGGIVIVDTPAVQVGGLLENVGASMFFEVDDTPANDHYTVGRAITGKAAGSAGYVFTEAA